MKMDKRKEMESRLSERGQCLSGTMPSSLVNYRSPISANSERVYVRETFNIDYLTPTVTYGGGPPAHVASYIKEIFSAFNCSDRFNAKNDLCILSHVHPMAQPLCRGDNILF